MEESSILVPIFSLDECVECRACSEACPSYRNGGLDPQKTISNVIGNLEPSQIWTCLQCHRCTLICPQEIDVAGMMLALRGIDAKKGNAPEKYKKATAAMIKDGCVSIPKGRMELLRKDLGLSEVKADERSVKELNSILRSAGFPYE